MPGKILFQSAAIIFALLATTIAAPPANAQFMRDHESEGRVRGFHATRPFGAIKRSFQSDAEARAELNRILTAIGLNWIGDRIVLRATAETANAEAGISSDGRERFIFYNADFMQRLKQRTAEQWTLVSILAHEVGHHLAFHTVITGRDHEFELEADYFSGFVLRRLGATLDQSQGAIRAISPKEATPTHPGLDQRLQVITVGWTDAGNQGAPRGVKGSLPDAPTAMAPQTTPPAQPTAKAVAPTRCPQEQAARSKEGNTSVTMNFQNKTDGTIRLYWIDYQGARKPYGEILPGNSHTQPTYLTHPWVVADSLDRCLGFYMPNTSQRPIVIGGVR